jgi:hypothetical protein
MYFFTSVVRSVSMEVICFAWERQDCPADMYMYIYISILIRNTELIKLSV